MDERRADPDELLRKLQQETEDSGRGHLKIFVGYAAGVGKTYAMLKAAHAMKRRGLDVVVGYVEPHTRPQTLQLLNGLECLPVKSVDYKGIRINEFDLDTAIKRNPRIMMVDELAHTNAEGSRHRKRYQDIEELLKAGIDVYTTVNIQHIESLNDIVASITGVMVRERIPDSVFDGAGQVELVDIEPEELIERLNAGKIYKESQAKKALHHFFSTENLVALRELALRRCADRVNSISEKARNAQGNDYYTDEHILVCLSSSPTNPKIIRTAARMARAFKGEFTALYVETPSHSEISDNNRERLHNNIKLAEQLGATIETVYGDDIAQQICEFARVSGVSKVVVGRSNAARKHFFGKHVLTERLIMNAPNLDIYIIPDKETPAFQRAKKEEESGKWNIKDTVRSILCLSIATAIGYLFYGLGFSEANIITVYILSVLITSIITSQRAYSLISSVISVLVFNYFFTVPRYSLQAYDKGYPVTFLIMFIAAFLTGTLAVRIKNHARQSAETAYRTKILLETNQLLQQQRDFNGIRSVMATQLVKLLKRDIVFYAAEKGRLVESMLFPSAEQEDRPDYFNENEKAVAAWVLKNNKRAGATTNTLGSSKCLYLAIRVNEMVFGVVGIAIPSQPMEAFENSIMLSVLGECALAMKNERVSAESREAAILAKNEQLRANLLRSISHDLRTPLTSISGNAGILLANEEAIDKERKKQLYTDIYDDSLWLIKLVENLLSVTRIEDGTMKLNLEGELMDEVIDEAMKHISRKKEEHTITVRQNEDFIMANMDARLIVQVIINLVDNAIKYTQVGSHITVSTAKQGDLVIVSVADEGKGISDEVKEKIFEMFYTADNRIGDSRRSLGLGLALCKSIVNAHGGEITVEDNQPTGCIFRFTLPAKEVKLHE